jgi:hypothetical protein
MNVSYIIHSWPNYWYGFWWSPAHDYDEFPTLESATDASWRPHDKELLVAYLEQSPILLASMSQTTCLLCPNDVSAASYQFDGKWFWPRSLSHYVGRHSIVLPDRFVQHIRGHGCTPLREDEVANVRVRDLPWPESCGRMRTLEL